MLEGIKGIAKEMIEGIAKEMIEGIAKEMIEVGYERTWQQCRVQAKNILSDHPKTTRSSKMHAERIESFLLFYTLRCFDRK